MHRQSEKLLMKRSLLTVSYIGPIADERNMPMEYWWNDAEGGKSRYSEKNASNRHFIKQQIRNERLKLGTSSA